MPPLCDRSIAAPRIAGRIFSHAALKIFPAPKYFRSALSYASKMDRFAQQQRRRRDQFTGKSAERGKTHSGDDAGRKGESSHLGRRSRDCMQRSSLWSSRLIYLPRPNSTSRRKCDKLATVTRRAR